MSHNKINIPVKVEFLVPKDASLQFLGLLQHDEMYQLAREVLQEVMGHDVATPGVGFKRAEQDYKIAERALQSRALDKSEIKVDPWTLRTEFLSWNPTDWRTFVDAMGILDIQSRSKADFAEWQRLLREAMVTPPGEWRSLSARFHRGKVEELCEPLPMQFEWEPMPIARIRTSLPLEAMIATIQLEALNGSQFRYCARKDCGAPPFKLESRHQRIYCSPDCAHLVAVRQSRARTKKLKSPKRR